MADLTRRYERQATEALLNAVQRADPEEEWVGRTTRGDLEKLVETLDELGWRLQPKLTCNKVLDDFWCPVPCGHPNDPVAAWVETRDGPLAFCHCGGVLDPERGIIIDDTPGPIAPCSFCGCATAVPPRDTQ